MRTGMRKPQSLLEWVRLGTTSITLARAGWAGIGALRGWRQVRADSQLYSVSISEGDDPWLYGSISRWAMEQVPSSTRKNIVAAQFNNRLREVPPEGNMTVTVMFEGEPIRFWWHEVGGEEADLGSLKIELKSATQVVTMICPDLDTRNRLISFLEMEFIAKESKVRRVYRSRKMGGWGWVRNMNGRSPDTLVLPEGMYDDMHSDITRFLESEQDYMKLGIPWHRGLLLYGPPGTGKSSTISTLAAAFDRDVHFMSLSELDSNSALADSVGGVGNGFLVLEDVDIVRASHERDASEGVSLDGLLNVLDGVLTPDGLVTFMTTNDTVDENGVFTKLDPALVRPGRADKQYKLDYLTQEQLDRMIQRFVGDGERIELGRDDAVPAEIIECLKSSFDQPAEYVLDCIREVVAAGYQQKYKPRRIDLGDNDLMAETEEAVPDER